MAHVMTKQGSLDNVVTYEFMCDTLADMNAIENKYKTMGSVAIVLQGESGELEVYICGSNKQWNNLGAMGGSSNSGISNIDLSQYYQKPSGGIPVSDLADFSKSEALTPVLTANDIMVNSGSSVNRFSFYSVNDFVEGPAVLTIGQNEYNINLVIVQSDYGTVIKSQETDDLDNNLCYIYIDNTYPSGNQLYIYSDTGYPSAQSITLSLVKEKINIDSYNLFLSNDKKLATEKDVADTIDQLCIKKEDSPIITVFAYKYSNSINTECELQFNYNEGDPIPYHFWFDKDRYIRFITSNGEYNTTGLYKAYMDNYVVYFDQIDGDDYFQSGNIISDSLGWNNQTKMYYKGHNPSASSIFMVNGTVDASTGQITLDKTWQTISNMFENKPIYIKIPLQGNQYEDYTGTQIIMVYGVLISPESTYIINAYDNINSTVYNFTTDSNYNHPIYTPDVD